MSFRKILCPTDFSPGSQQAIRTAARLARDDKAELVLIHSWYVPPPAVAGEYVFPANVIQDIVDDAQRALDADVALAKSEGAPRVVGKLLSDTPWVDIVTMLEKDTFDLCVIGTHGRTGVARVLLGSVAEKVIRHAPCPVLAVRPESEPAPFSHVLVPTDFSESSRQAGELATQVVQSSGKITLFHVLELPVPYAGELPMADIARDLDSRSADALDRWRAELAHKGHFVVATHTRVGYSGGQTLAMLDADPTIDLVVMGSHGRTGLKRALLGSVAEKVVRHARCPVLVARK